MTAPTVEFWYDFASTYSYPAAMTIGRRAADRGVKVEWRPFLLGPIFNAQQGLTDSPFNVQKEKGAWMWRDLERTCEALHLQLTRPTVFPRNSLNAARAALACEAEGLDVGAFSRAVYDANFAKDLDISDVGVIGELLAEIDYSGAAVLERMRSDAVKAALKAQTDRAAAGGLFGAPTITTSDGELFWGQDRVDQALDWAARLSSPRAAGGGGPRNAVEEPRASAEDPAARSNIPLAGASGPLPGSAGAPPSSMGETNS